jgi:uncharacterized membrane protein YdbT with pleckstrin-like domain
MSYIQDNLMPNEKILFSARSSPAVFVQSIVGLVITIVIFIYGISNAIQISQPGSPTPEPSIESTIGGLVLCFSGIMFLTSIVLGFEAVMIMSTTEFAVTDRRVIAKSGFIRRHTLEIFLPKIESVAVRQNWLGMLLNFGTVTVIGTGGTRGSFRAIANPVSVRKKINQIIENTAVKT